MLHLRYARAEDVAFITSTQHQPEVKEFIGAADSEKIRAEIDNPEQAFLLAIRNENIPVGYAHLRGIKLPERSIELYQLAIAERNKGYGGVFLKLIMAEAFEILNANRLWLDVFPENARARAVYQRCGFIEEGVLREVYFRDGEFRSTVVMSILASELAIVETEIK